MIGEYGPGLLHVCCTNLLKKTVGKGEIDHDNNEQSLVQIEPTAGIFKNV